jgi:hypothetical protein
MDALLKMNAEKEEFYTLYADWLERKGCRPFTVYQFLKKTEFEEADFYGHFRTIGELERMYWQEQFAAVRAALSADPVYAAYSVREKLLAFYFTLIEHLRERRLLIRGILEKRGPLRLWPSALRYFRQYFLSFARELVEEGLTSGEIADRPFITDRYPDALSFQLLFVLRFWSKDASEELQDTDAAIEKAVRFLFDLLESNSIDSFFDLSRFLVQHR